MPLSATHVGSLPRPQEVVDFLFARERGEACVAADFDACMTAAVLENFRSKGQGELQKDIANLKAAMAAHDVARGFMNAASPGDISLFLHNAHYPDRRAHLEALADAMRDEYRTILDAGLELQLDCPDLALSRHLLFTDLTDAEFLAVAATHVEALQHALDTTTNFVEHPDLVAERLKRFVDIVGAERVIAGSDWGFGTFAGFGAVDPEIAWAKLATLKEGARRVG